jgi:hypothetical protein
MVPFTPFYLLSCMALLHAPDAREAWSPKGLYRRVQSAEIGQWKNVSFRRKPTVIMVVTIQLGVQLKWKCSDTETG